MRGCHGAWTVGGGRAMERGARDAVLTKLCHGALSLCPGGACHGDPIERVPYADAMKSWVRKPQRRRALCQCQRITSGDLSARDLGTRRRRGRSLSRQRDSEGDPTRGSRRVRLDNLSGAHYER